MKKNIILKLIAVIAILFYYSCKTVKPIGNSLNKSVLDTIQDSSHLSFYKGDTIAYVNYIFNNQAKYIGKPLSVLLHDLDFKIYQFGYNGPRKRDGKVYSIRLQTNSNGQNKKVDKYGNDQEIELGIGWQSYVLQDSIIAIIRADNSPIHFSWSKKAEEYFGKQIVGNLWLMDYMKR